MNLLMKLASTTVPFRLKILMSSSLCPTFRHDHSFVLVFNPDTTEVKVVMNKILNKVFSQGMKTTDMWKEVFGRFWKEKSTMNVTDFYAGDRVNLLNDLRSMRDNDYLGSGLKLMNTKEGS